jgi:hypothetical protein
MSRRVPARPVPNPYRKRLEGEVRASAARWGKIVLKAALVPLVTVLILDARIASDGLFWVPLGISMLAGIALILCGIGERHCSALFAEVPISVRRTWPPEMEPAPRIGQVLVRDLGLVRAQDFGRALAYHRKHGGPVGQVLLEMGLVTACQLQEALERQRCQRGRCGQPWEDTARFES